MPSVIVTCDGAARPVFIDNQNQGTTDTLLSVAEGLHVFDLGLPANYLPAFQEVSIENDSGPTIVPFALVAAVVARARKRRAAARKRVSADKRARASRRTPLKATAKKGAASPRKRASRKNR